MIAPNLERLYLVPRKVGREIALVNRAVWYFGEANARTQNFDPLSRPAFRA